MVVVLLEELFHGLLANAVVAEVVELLQFIHEVPLLHALVHLRYQVLECLFYVCRVHGTRLHEIDLLLLCEACRFSLAHGSFVFEVTFVSN